MHESMRYHTSKLSELLHERRSYNLHMSSVGKIMHKTSNEFALRDRQLSELKSRKMQAYNHTQHVRSREIGHVNALLFAKIHKEALMDRLEEEEPVLDFPEQIEQREAEKAQGEEAGGKKGTHPFVLRNHRQSPIHKSTLLERTRENIRLAKRIVQPVVTYRTKEYEKLHQDTKAIKDRIMRYEPALAKPKADLYVTKRLNASWASIQKKSHLTSPRSAQQNSNNPENIFQQRFSEYRFT